VLWIASGRQVNLLKQASEFYSDRVCDVSGVGLYVHSWLNVLFFTLYTSWIASKTFKKYFHIAEYCHTKDSKSSVGGAMHVQISGWYLHFLTSVFNEN